MSDYMNACSYVKDSCVLFCHSVSGAYVALHGAHMVCGRSMRRGAVFLGCMAACVGYAVWFAVRYYATDTHLPRVGTLDQSHLRSAHAETEQP